MHQLFGYDIIIFETCSVKLNDWMQIIAFVDMHTITLQATTHTLMT